MPRARSPRQQYLQLCLAFDLKLDVPFSASSHKNDYQKPRKPLFDKRKTTFLSDPATYSPTLAVDLDFRVKAAIS